MHVPTTLEKQRATMERKGSNYVYVAFCIHIDPAVMGTSSCDCAFIYILIYVGVLEKTVENFCSSIVLNTVNLEQRESIRSELGRGIYRIILHIFAGQPLNTIHLVHRQVWAGESYFRLGRRGIKYESLHSSDKAQRNPSLTTWERVRTFSLIYFVFLLRFLHTCSTDILSQALSGGSL